MKKRLLSLFLTFSMLLTFFPVGTVTVFASDSQWCLDVLYRVFKLFTHFISHDFSDPFDVTAETQAVVLNFYISNFGYVLV